MWGRSGGWTEWLICIPKNWPMPHSLHHVDWFCFSSPPHRGIPTERSTASLVTRRSSHPGRWGETCSCPGVKKFSHRESCCNLSSYGAGSSWQPSCRVKIIALWPFAWLTLTPWGLMLLACWFWFVHVGNSEKWARDSSLQDALKLRCGGMDKAMRK